MSMHEGEEHPTTLTTDNPRLDEVIADFADVPKSLRLEALLDYSRRVPALPAELAGNHDLMEKVEECQTPFYLFSQLADDGTIILHFDAPPEAPTTRGFAGILWEALNGAALHQVLATPDDFYVRLGLAELISPLRLRGMSAILSRVKRQARALGAADARSAQPTAG